MKPNWKFFHCFQNNSSPRLRSGWNKWSAIQKSNLTEQNWLAGFLCLLPKPYPSVTKAVLHILIKTGGHCAALVTTKSRQRGSVGRQMSLTVKPAFNLQSFEWEVAKYWAPTAAWQFSVKSYYISSSPCMHYFNLSPPQGCIQSLFIVYIILFPS